jgi:predicted lipoprotein with Yx(FWY)xxD motif
MRRAPILLAGVLASVACVATAASAQQGIPTAHADRVTTVGLRHTSLGTILVNSSGRTLYEFSRDHGGKDTCMGIAGCAEAWPALTTSGKPKAASGVHAGLLSMITLKGGSKQVTYAGHPLYLYSGDSGPGETSYVGEKAFGGTWDALNASGQAVK